MSASTAMLSNHKRRKQALQWLTVAGALLSYTICEGVTYSFSVFYTILLEEFHESKAFTALAGALLMGLPELIAPITGSYINAFGTRVGAFTGAFILSISYFAMLFVNDLTSLCINMGLCTSIGQSLGYLSAMLAIERRFKTKIAFATGIAVSGSGIGVAIFPPFVELLHEMYGWRNSCLILGAVCMNLAVAGATFQEPPKSRVSKATSTKPENQLKQTETDAGMEIEIEAETGTETETLSNKAVTVNTFQRMSSELASSFKQLFDKRIYTMQFGRLCIANAVVSAGLVIPMIFTVHVAELQGVDSFTAASLMSVMGITSSFGQCALGWLATKLPLFAVYVVSISLSGIATALIPFATSFGALAGFCGIFGFMYGSYHALMSTLVLAVSGRELFTPAYGVYTIFQGIGDVSASPLSGLVFDWLKSYDVAFYVGGLSMTLPVILLLLPETIRELKEWRNRSPSVAGSAIDITDAEAHLSNDAASKPQNIDSSQV